MRGEGAGYDSVFGEGAAEPLKIWFIFEAMTTFTI